VKRLFQYEKATGFDEIWSPETATTVT